MLLLRLRGARVKRSVRMRGGVVAAALAVFAAHGLQGILVLGFLGRQARGCGREGAAGGGGAREEGGEAGGGWGAAGYAEEGGQEAGGWHCWVFGVLGL